jgi:hypothetical protein
MSFSSMSGLASCAAFLSILQTLAITLVCITATVYLIKAMKKK